MRRVPKEFARLTAEDRAIFDRIPLRIHAEYRFAGATDAVASLRAIEGGFINAAVIAEHARRSVELGRAP